MGLSIPRCFLCCVLTMILPVSTMGQALPEQAAGAILHTQGGVWVNGYEARDSSAVFAGDVIETKVGATANLTLSGTTVLMSPESVGKFQTNLMELDHGSVSVGTSTGFKVRVNCVLVTPVVQEWTQYIVTDLNGTIQVSANKKDVNVDHEAGRAKPAAENEPTQHASVHEGEQKSFDESGICGAAAKPTSPMNGISPKWIAAGAAGVGVLVFILIHGGGSPNTPVSPSSP
jgi:hypothetical protein